MLFTYLKHKVKQPSSFVCSANFSSMASAISSLLLFLLLVTLASEHASGETEIIFEDGYTVSTIFDGNKQLINPFSVLPRPGTHDIIILDSSNSVFYTLSFPISQGSAITQFSGNGSAGFADGNSGSAMFDRPRSFAVDLKGNVYVADKNNHAIRKITLSGPLIQGNTTYIDFIFGGISVAKSSSGDASGVHGVCRLKSPSRLDNHD